jgi:predicted nucleotidyltransferase
MVVVVVGEGSGVPGRLTIAPKNSTIGLIMGTDADPGLVGQTLFSRNRRAVLGLLYGHPDEKFYFRQIVRLSGGGVGAIQRELKQLAEAGLLCRTVRGNQVYFQASGDCPVFEEMKSILAKTAGAADILRAALAPLVDRISVAFIYGSVARGQQRAESDVDLLLIGDATFGEVVATLAEAQTRLCREVNATVYPSQEFSAKIRAGHHFVKSIVKREKIFLIGDERELKRLAEERVAD